MTLNKQIFLTLLAFASIQACNAMEYFSTKNNEDQEIEKKLSQDLLDKTPNKVLRNAIQEGSLKFVKKLLSLGANPNFQYPLGWTPLHYACKNGYYEIVEFLLSKGADLTLKDSENRTPLHNACLDSGYILEGHDQVVKVIINHVKDVEVLLELINMKNKDGKTPLMIAIEHNKDRQQEVCQNIVNLLLKSCKKNDMENSDEGFFCIIN